MKKIIKILLISAAVTILGFGLAFVLIYGPGLGIYLKKPNPQEYVLQAVKFMDSQGIYSDTDEWKHARDETIKKAEDSYIAENTQNICQIAVRKNGEEIYSDEWNGYKRDDCVHVMSVTKSIMALLVGIAVDNGQIGSVSDKVLSYFPEYAVKRGEKTAQDVTIRHKRI